MVISQRLDGLERIKAVLFDVDGTLYVQAPLRAAMACEMAVAYATARGRRERQFVRIVASFRRLREQLRDELADESLARRQYSVVAQRLGCAEDDVVRIVEEWIHQRPLKWLKYCRRPGLVPFLDECSSRGLRVGVFSDYPCGEKLAALGIADRFDFALSATDADVNAFKPRPHGFLAAARRWGFSPSQVLYVGDRQDVDAAGAQAAGMPCLVLGSRNTSNGAAVRTVIGFEEIQRVIASNRYA